MNPTGRNIASSKEWKGRKSPWLGTKSIWKLVYNVGLLDENLFKDIIKDNIINFEYKTKNNRTFSVISLNKDIGEMEKSLIKGQLDNKIYHIEISNNDNGKNVIEIHLKSSFNQEQELGKEKNK